MVVVLLNLFVATSTLGLVSSKHQEDERAPSPPLDVDEVVRLDVVNAIRTTVKRLFFPKNNRTKSILGPLAKDVAAYLLPALQSGKSGFAEYEESNTAVGG